MTNFKQTLRDMPLIGALSVKAYQHLFKKHPVDFWISKYISSNPSIIIQIGSNDGKTGDPIFSLINKRESWKAILVEPVPYLFERLKANYKEDSRFIFENIAINEGQEQTFYSVRQEARDDFPDLPSWYDQLGSFIRENITKHLDGKLEPYIEEIKLPGITLSNLFTKHSVNHIDLLHIDTEGYDWRILSQLSLNIYKPSIILYEYKHLSESEKEQSIKFLMNDYHIFKFGGDFLSIRKEIFKKNDLKRIKGKLITLSNKI